RRRRRIDQRHRPIARLAGEASTARRRGATQGPGGLQLGIGGRPDRARLPACRRPRVGGHSGVLTVDFDRLGIGPSTRVIAVGCGAGRHTFEAYRRGADVVAFDRDVAELQKVDEVLRAMAEKGEAPPSATAETLGGDALSLPYPDQTFDVVIASEI